MTLQVYLLLGNGTTYYWKGNNTTGDSLKQKLKKIIS